MASRQSRALRAAEARHRAALRWLDGEAAYRELGPLTRGEVVNLDLQPLPSVRRYLTNIYGRAGQHVAWQRYRTLSRRFASGSSS